MSHILVTLHGLEKNIVEDILLDHTHKNTLAGIHLEHIWQNADDSDEVIFLFKTDSKEKAGLFLEKITKETTRYTPTLPHPEIIYLKK